MIRPDEQKPLLQSPTRKQKEAEIKKRSLLPVIVAIEIAFTVFWILNGVARPESTVTIHETFALLTVPLLQAVWAIGVTRIGHQSQLFAQDRILDSSPMIWLPLFPIVLQTTIFRWQWSTVSQLLLLSSSWQFVVALQGIRALAVGSLIKWSKGLFPAAFAWGTAFPDMIFGLSTWVLLFFVGDLDKKHLQLLAFWNTVGLVIILPIGILVVQLGMKPTQLYLSKVPMRLVFEYPMVLGPAVAVPILLAWNVVLIKFALEQIE